MKEDDHFFEKNSPVRGGEPMVVEFRKFTKQKDLVIDFVETQKTDEYHEKLSSGNF